MAAPRPFTQETRVQIPVAPQSLFHKVSVAVKKIVTEKFSFTVFFTSEENSDRKIFLHCFLHCSEEKSEISFLTHEKTREKN